MSGLRELQPTLGRAVLGHDEPSLGDAIDGDGLAPAARLQIYRHHYEILADRGLEGDLSCGLPAGGRALLRLRSPWIHQVIAAAPGLPA